MPLTREFKETVQARLRADRKYRKELLREGVECLLAGDLDTGKAILRDYINATIGFEELSRRTKRPAKSLMRMLGPSGAASISTISRASIHRTPPARRPRAWRYRANSRVDQISP